MFARCWYKKVVLIVLSVLMLGVSICKADSLDAANQTGISEEEKYLTAELGLAEDCNDVEIIQCLDIPAKRISAATLIRYRKIPASVPKLKEIVNSKEATIPTKLCVAEALCDFGNKDWISPIKVLLADKKHEGFISLKVDIAGLLARAGDYSRFEIVADHVNNSKCHVRSAAINALGNFGHETEKVTDSAAELLLSVAVSDPVPWLRERAIEKLEKIAARKPVIESKVIEALEANKDSSDKYLRMISRAKLKHRGR